MIGQSLIRPASVRDGGTAIDSRTSSPGSPVRSRSRRPSMGVSIERGFQSDGCNGAMILFQDRTRSNLSRSAANPGASSSAGVTSGIAALFDTRRTRPPSRNRPSSIAAASVIAPNSVEA
nr:hypothetical protein [Microbispora sp. GKU 823]